MSTESRKSTSSRLIVTAIDIGTTHSGYAFSFRSDWTRVFTNEWKGQKIASYKVSTNRSILLDMKPRKRTQILLYTARMKVDRLRSTIFFIDLRKR